MPQAVMVQVTRGGQLVAQHQFDLAKKVVKIGRSPTAQIRVEDPAASRVHAVLEFGPTGVALVDLGTSAGTLVNGTRVNRVSIGNGDQITIGETTLFISVLEAGAPAAPPAATPYQPLPTRPTASPFQPPPARPAASPFQPPPTRPAASPFQPPPTRPAASPFPPPPGRVPTSPFQASPTRPGPSPFLPPPAGPAARAYAIPGGAPTPSAPPSAASAPTPTAQPLRFGEAEAPGYADPLPDSDPIMARMKQARRQRLIIFGGLVVIGGLVVALMIIFQTPRQIPGAVAADAETKRAAAAGDPVPAAAKPGDPGPNALAAALGDGARPAGDPSAPTPAPAPTAFDAAELRDETRFAYHRLSKVGTLESIATELYGNATRATVLAQANAGIKTVSDSLAVGVELRVPRFVEVVVKPGDTLSKIAAAELGAEAAFQEIVEANRDQIDSADALAAGMKLKIPILKPAP
jgi:hypothetical protein